MSDLRVVCVEGMEVLAMAYRYESPASKAEP